MLRISQEFLELVLHKTLGIYDLNYKIQPEGFINLLKFIIKCCYSSTEYTISGPVKSPFDELIDDIINNTKTKCTDNSHTIVQLIKNSIIYDQVPISEYHSFCEGYVFGKFVYENINTTPNFFENFWIIFKSVNSLDRVSVSDVIYEVCVLNDCLIEYDTVNKNKYIKEQFRDANYLSYCINLLSKIYSKKYGNVNNDTNCCFSDGLDVNNFKIDLLYYYFHTKGELNLEEYYTLISKINVELICNTKTYQSWYMELISELNKYEGDSMNHAIIENIISFSILGSNMTKTIFTECCKSNLNIIEHLSISKTSEYLWVDMMRIFSVYDLDEYNTFINNNQFNIIYICTRYLNLCGIKVLIEKLNLKWDKMVYSVLFNYELNGVNYNLLEPVCEDLGNNILHVAYKLLILTFNCKSFNKNVIKLINYLNSFQEAGELYFNQNLFGFKPLEYSCFILSKYKNMIRVNSIEHLLTGAALKAITCKCKKSNEILIETNVLNFGITNYCDLPTELLVKKKQLHLFKKSLKYYKQHLKIESKMKESIVYAMLTQKYMMLNYFNLNYDHYELKMKCKKLKNAFELLNEILTINNKLYEKQFKPQNQNALPISY